MKWTKPIMLCAAAIAFAGCNPSSEPGSEPETNAPPATGEVQNQREGNAMTAPSAYDTTDVNAPAATPPATVESAAVETKEGYVAALEQKLEDLDAKIDDLSEKAANLTGEVRAEAAESLSALREQQDNAEVKLEELKTATSDAWAEIKEGFESVLSELEKAYEDAKAKFS